MAKTFEVKRVLQFWTSLFSHTWPAIARELDLLWQAPSVVQQQWGPQTRWWWDGKVPIWHSFEAKIPWGWCGRHQVWPGGRCGQRCWSHGHQGLWQGAALLRWCWNKGVEFRESMIQSFKIVPLPLRPGRSIVNTISAGRSWKQAPRHCQLSAHCVMVRFLLFTPVTHVERNNLLVGHFIVSVSFYFPMFAVVSNWLQMFFWMGQNGLSLLSKQSYGSICWLKTWVNLYSMFMKHLWTQRQWQRPVSSTKSTASLTRPSQRILQVQCAPLTSSQP